MPDHALIIVGMEKRLVMNSNRREGRVGGQKQVSDRGNVSKS